MGVQVAEDEPAAVEKDDEGVRTAGFRRGVEPRGESPGGAVYRQIPHGAHADRGTVGDGDLAAVRLTRIGRREGLQGGSAAALEQREAELHLGFEGLPVDAHGGPTREADLEPRRQRTEQAGGAELEALAGGEGGLRRGPGPAGPEGTP